jgi:hypothetical protein
MTPAATPRRLALASRYDGPGAAPPGRRGKCGHRLPQRGPPAGPQAPHLFEQPPAACAHQLATQDGHTPGLPFMSHLHDDLPASFRPLVFYACTELIGLVGRAVMWVSAQRPPSGRPLRT